MKSIEILEGTMDTTITQNNGWGAVLDHDKLGFVPVSETIGASFKMEMTELTQPIQVIHFMTMKS